MKRIFYYSGYRLTIFHWLNTQCVATYVFNPGEEGLDKFKTYLLATENSPVRILVDLIEEDFKKENIPHVGPIDRKSIVRRLIDRHYRKSKDYVYYKVVGRETSGRKDDILLYSVLSNPDILEPWLNVIHECNTSVCGIWSLPLLTRELYNKIGINNKNVLLVSQQVPSNLRQTFIKDGHFDSSRSAVVNLDDASIGEYIASEVEQTIRFLSNQRQIGFDEKIEIHVICRQSDQENIKSHCLESALRSFIYISLDDLEEKLGCIITNPKEENESPNQNIEYSNAIYSYICAKKIIPIGHYGAVSLFKKYYAQIASQAIYSCSVLMLIIASLFSFSYLSESSTLSAEVIILERQKEGINNLYQRQLANLEHKLEKTQIMQSTVLLVEHIKKSNQLSPQNFMIDISRILTRSGMYDTEITKVHWQKFQSNTLPKANTRATKHSIDHTDPAEINQLASITGFIRVSQNSMKESINKINAIISAFKNNKLVRSVRIKSMPIDMSSDATLENETDIEKQQNTNADKEKGKFEIELLMRGSESS